MVVCWLLMLALVSGLLLAHRNEWHRLEWLLKPAAAATFVTAGFLAGGIDTTFGRVMLAGLVLAAGGDVLLIPKNKRAFLAGIGAFWRGMSPTPSRSRCEVWICLLHSSASAGWG